MPTLSMENIMANEETIKSVRPIFTAEQKDAWKKAKLLLKSLTGNDVIRFRALHSAMSELRSKYKKNPGPIERESTDPNKAHQKRVNDAAVQLRQRIDTWKAYLDNPGSKKLFIITDNELTDSQKAVQSAHCVAQFQKDHPFAPWSNGILVLLVPDPEFKRWQHLDESALQVFSRWHDVGWNYITFWSEEDMDDKLTSIAILDDFREAGKLNGLKML
jgi:hypothetical protein